MDIDLHNPFYSLTLLLQSAHVGYVQWVFDPKVRQVIESTEQLKRLLWGLRVTDETQNHQFLLPITPLEYSSYSLSLPNQGHSYYTELGVLWEGDFRTFIRSNSIVTPRKPSTESSSPLLSESGKLHQLRHPTSWR